MHSNTNKSVASMDPSEEYIDLDRALVEDELRSLVSTPEHQHNQQFKISLKSMDERKTERFRRSLVTPLPKYNHSMNLQQSDWCATTNKSSNDSCAESVALFKNLANNEDHIDFVSSDLKEFMSSYDMDDLMSRSNSRAPLSPHRHRDILTSSRLRNHNMQKTPEPLVEQKSILRHTNNKSYTNMVSHNPTSGMLKPMSKVTTYHDETIAIPRKHSFDSIEESRKQSSHSNPPVAETLKTGLTILPNQTNNDRLQKILKKRQSVDSDALKKLKIQESKMNGTFPTRLDVKLKPTEKSTVSKSKHVSTSTAIPAPTASSRRTSLLRQPDSRRWSTRISEQQIEAIKKSPLISPRQMPINTSKRNSVISYQNDNSLLGRKKQVDIDRLAPFSTRSLKLPLKSLSDETRHQIPFDATEELCPSSPSNFQNSIRNVSHTNNPSSINKAPEEETKNFMGSTFKRYMQQDRAVEEQSASDALLVNPSASRHSKRLNTLDAVSRQRSSIEPTLQRCHNTSANRHSISYTNRHESAGKEESLSSSHIEHSRETNMYKRRAKPSTLTVETHPHLNTNMDNDDYHQLASEENAAVPLTYTPTTRYRKFNNNLTRYTHVAENVSPLVATPSKEVRFSKANVFISHPNDVHIAASQSSGGLSNSTGSSHSGEHYYDPPLSANTRSSLLSQKRCSIPVLNTALIEEQARKSEHRYSSYLARTRREDESVKDYTQDDVKYPEHSSIRFTTRQRPRAISTEEDEGYTSRKNFGSSTLRKPLQREEVARDEYIPRRRVLSEDNKGIKGQRRSLRQHSASSSNESSPTHTPVKTSTNQREYERSMFHYRSSQQNTSIPSEEPPRRLQRGTSTENVTESARKVLAFVQQRRSIKQANQQVNSNRRSLHF